MKCFWLLNHKIIDIQKEDLYRNYNITEIEYMPDAIAMIWADLPLGSSVDRKIIASIETWIGSFQDGDIAIVQGDATYSFTLIDRLIELGIPVFAAVTERIVTERMEGDTVVKKSIFKHVCFRRYERY